MTGNDIVQVTRYQISSEVWSSESSNKHDTIQSIKYQVSPIRYQVSAISYKISSTVPIKGLNFNVISTRMHGKSRK